jgi:hypothetical protein
MIGGVLGMGRRMAESRMTDTCKVTRISRGVLNESTGKHPETITQVYTGPCRVKHSSMAPMDIEAGSQLLTLGTPEIHVPAGTATFHPDDQVEITWSGTRADQIGRLFKVIAPFDGTQTTALRYRVEADDGR